MVLTRLPKLHTLDLHDNLFAGPLPEFPAVAGQGDDGGAAAAEARPLALRHLDLSTNRWTGPLPRSVSNLVMLENVDLQHSHVSGNLPECLASMVKLRELYIYDTAITSPARSGKRLMRKAPWLVVNALQCYPTATPYHDAETYRV